MNGVSEWTIIELSGPKISTSQSRAYPYRKAGQLTGLRQSPPIDKDGRQASDKESNRDDREFPITR